MVERILTDAAWDRIRFKWIVIGLLLGWSLSYIVRMILWFGGIP